jgi:hypothetical protein
MALKRKPVQKQAEPAYPDAEKYAADRRQFLALLGASAMTALGLSGCGELVRPNAAAAGEMMPVGPGAAAAGAPLPATVTDPNATPMVVDCEKPIAPEAQPMGEMPAVQPLTDPAGGVRVIRQDPEPGARPESQIKGGVRTIKPTAHPQAQIEGDMPAVEPVPPPEVKPQAIIRGEMPAVENPPPAVNPKSNTPGGRMSRPVAPAPGSPPPAPSAAPDESQEF